jgi:hypothetical protein
LGLKGSQYNTCISILYVGYLFAQIPSNMILSSKKVRPSIYMGCCMIVWGIVATLTACVKNYTGLVLVRFFLGFVEAPFYPGALYILSLFYTRKEIATRVSILYAGNIFAVAFAGLIAAATFATLDKKYGMHGWQWLFIIEGVVTVGIAVICIFILPDTPLTTRWLTEEQRQLAHDRIERDTVGIKESKGAKAGFMQALRDPRLYLLVFMQNMHLSATSFNQVRLHKKIRHDICQLTNPVLPHCCQVSWLQHYYHPGPHSAPNACRWRSGHSRRHLIRKVQRPNMAYYLHDGPRCHWFPHQRYNTQHCRTIHLMFSLRFWCLLCKLSHSRLGFRHSGPNTREEGCFAVYCQCLLDG